MHKQYACGWKSPWTGLAYHPASFYRRLDQAGENDRLGIAPENQFLLWDWVGGRYSLWSCIGLPIALTIGVQGFKYFLAGANAVDEHFQGAPFEQNIPVLMGFR